MVLAFLEDYRDSLARDAFRAFLAGELSAVQESEARGRFLFADDMLQLEYGSLLRFYGLEVSDE